MIKGLYAAASAMLANLSRQGALSHNISNLDTPGFKQIMVSLDDFKNTSVVNPLTQTSGLGQLQYIGDIGLGVEPSPEITDFTQGGLKITNQPLDFAFQGPGFFRVQTPDGERYTRDGRFDRDVDGNLVTIDGYKVLDDSGSAITLPEGDVSLANDGSISVNNQTVAKLGLASFSNPQSQLTRDVSNTYSSADSPDGEELGTVQQGYLEMSNANTSEIMTQMVTVARAYEASEKMVSTQDDMLGKAISTLGKFQ